MKEVLVFLFLILSQPLICVAEASNTREEEKEEGPKIDDKTKEYLWTAGIFVLGAAGVVVATPALLSIIGFTSTGIALNSVAATLQSLGAGGIPLAMKLGLATIGGTAATYFSTLIDTNPHVISVVIPSSTSLIEFLKLFYICGSIESLTLLKPKSIPDPNNFNLTALVNFTNSKAALLSTLFNETMMSGQSLIIEMVGNKQIEEIIAKQADITVLPLSNGSFNQMIPISVNENDRTGLYIVAIAIQNGFKLPRESIDNALEIEKSFTKEFFQTTIEKLKQNFKNEESRNKFFEETKEKVKEKTEETVSWFKTRLRKAVKKVEEWTNDDEEESKKAEL